MSHSSDNYILRNRATSTSISMPQRRSTWSLSWEFDWSPAATAADIPASARRPSRSSDELAHLLDRALAYAG